MLSAEFGERVDRLRARRKWTLRQLAGAAGLPLSTLYRVVREGQHPKGSHASQLAKALDVSTDYLLTGRHPRRSA